jgi:hypothetical protein
VENLSTRRKALTYRKSRTQSLFQYTSPWAGIELTTSVGIRCKLLLFIHFYHILVVKCDDRLYKLALSFWTMHSLLQTRHKQYWACTLIWAITVNGLIRQWNSMYSLYLHTLCYILSKQNWRGGQFYWWCKPEYSGENNQPAAITDKLWAHLAWVRFDLRTSVVIGTDCIGGCKSNYHTITTTTTP